MHGRTRRMPGEWHASDIHQDFRRKCLQTQDKPLKLQEVHRTPHSTGKGALHTILRWKQQM